MPRAVSSCFALIKCARAILQISDRSQTLYNNVLQAGPNAILYSYGIMLIKYTAAIQK